MDVLLLLLRLLLAALLYGALAGMGWLLWRDLRRTRTNPQTVQRPGFLFIQPPAGELGAEERPPDQAHAPHTVFTLRPVTSIGRSPNNTIQLDDDFASAQHSLLTWRESQWWLEDCDSRNGTLLNGDPIDTPTVVSSGDMITVGRTKMRLEIRTSGPEQAASIVAGAQARKE